MDTSGCPISNSQYITIKDTCTLDLFIPNLIIVNDDQKNETFEIQKLPEGCLLEIYNRWGDCVYKNSFYDNSWKAQNLEAGVYYYMLDAGQKRIYKGWVQVMK